MESLERRSTMNILHVIPFVAPAFGGTVAVASQLSREQAKRGHHVTVLTSDYGYDEVYAQEIEECGATVIPLPTVVNLGLFIYTPSINRWLKQNGRAFDIVHMHNYRAYQNDCVSAYAKRHHIPYIVQAHGSVLPIVEKQHMKRLYDRFWGNALLAGAERVIALTDVEKSQYQSMGVPEDRIAIIPNGIELAPFDTLPKHGGFRRRLSITDETQILLFMGRLARVKRPDLLLEAFADLAIRWPDLLLVFAGPDDGCGPVLRERADTLGLTDRVIFPGYLDEEKKLEALVDADLFVLPSEYECFPVALVEALTAGLPVVVTDACGIAELVQSTGAGMVIGCSATELAKGIDIVLSDPETFRDTGRRRQMTSYDIQNVIDKLESLYSEILQATK